MEEQRRAAVAAQRLSVGAGRCVRPDAAAAQPGQQTTEPLDGAHLPPKRRQLSDAVDGLRTDTAPAPRSEKGRSFPTAPVIRGPRNADCSATVKSAQSRPESWHPFTDRIVSPPTYVSTMTSLAETLYVACKNS